MSMTSEMFAKLEVIEALRHTLHDNGYLPLSILTKSKIPSPATGFQERARRGECLRFFPVQHAMNSGLLCDRLRAIDIDTDRPEIVAALCDLTHRTFGGDPPTRYRANSPRKLMLYRTDRDNRSTISIKGKLGGVQILGRDHQFLAFGVHPSGCPIEWRSSPALVAVGALGAVSEAQEHEFLARAAKLIEAPPPAQIQSARRTKDDPVPRESQADIARVRDALSRIPNDGERPEDWEWWNRLGMALFAATGGAAVGLELWIGFSARHPAFSERLTRERWAHYHRSPPSSLTAGTLFHEADAADQRRLGSFLDLGVGR